MHPISCIIVDDEVRARNVLNNLLGKDFPQIEVLAQCENVPQAVEAIKAYHPQMVFLDVQMPEYAGYEIVDFFQPEELNFEIIFVTAHDEFAIKAFELSAADYLLKPINRVRLRAAIEKLSKKIEVSEQLGAYHKLLEARERLCVEKLILPELGDKRVLELKDIVAFEANGSYAIIHLADARTITISKNLKYFEGVLQGKPNFFRSHRMWLINLESIATFNKMNLVLHHKSGLDTALSRRKLPDFLEVFVT